jgi:ABC-type transport system substrate-binding protein
VSPTFSQFATTYYDFVKRELEANLGIRVEVTPADLATYVALATAREKTWEFFISSEGSITTIPDYNALTFWAPSGYGSIFGNLRLDSPVPENKSFAEESQRLFNEQAAELDPEARKEKLQEMQRFFLGEYRAAIPLPVGAYVYTARRDRVGNYPENDAQFGNSSAGAYRVANLYLES